MKRIQKKERQITKTVSEMISLTHDMACLEVQWRMTAHCYCYCYSHFPFPLATLVRWLVREKRRASRALVGVRM